MSTDKQIDANRLNAQHSTGPRTPEGKAKSSLNAVKSGLTGHTVLLPTDDVALYESHLTAVAAELRPFGPRESALVQSIADAEWRIQRIPALEHGIYAQGHLEFAPLYAAEDASLRASLIQTKTFLTYEKQLRNLQLQESRIRKHREKDLGELKELQDERHAQHKQRLDVAALGLIAACDAGTTAEWCKGENGFEFSIPRIAGRAHQLRPDLNFGLVDKDGNVTTDDRLSQSKIA
jgi:hypothetical protein